ncbi:hypothetical protein ACIA8C_39255 [Nocardia sp. NPDC051321]|uniref:hypothetical protein n=1 Tax=Nocardia sp. NPDC051321 TaxID=3364323 RepID=UPI00379B9E7E
MPDGYDKDRDGYDNNSRGRIFENGTYEHFRDRENGYVQGSEKYRAAGVKIKFDKVKQVGDKVRSIEENSGQMKGPKDEKQLEVVYELIRTGRIDHYTLRTVERELISERCQELIDKIRRDFPEKSTHLVIDRETAREIWAKGQQKEVSKRLGQQLELDKVREKAREGKAQALQNARDKQAGLAKAREVREKFRNMQKFREGVIRGRVEAPQRVQAERAQRAREQTERAKSREAPQAERDRTVREAAEKAVREFQARLAAGPTPAGKALEKTAPERETPEAARARVAREAAERVAREFPFPVPEKPRERETIEIGERSTPELADAATVEREAADQAQKQAREAAREQDAARNAAYERLQEQGRLTEVQRLHWLGQGTDPRGAVREPPGHAPPVQGHGRDGQGQGRERGQSRDR